MIDISAAHYYHMANGIIILKQILSIIFSVFPIAAVREYQPISFLNSLERKLSHVGQIMI